MKLVLLFFCVFLGLILALGLVFICSRLKLNIKELEISNIEGNIKKKKLEKKGKVYLELYLFGIIKIAKIKIKQKMLNKIKEREDIETVKQEAKVIKKVHPLEILKKLKIKLEEIDLNLKIGIDDVIITSYLVAFISSILRNNNCDFRPKNKNI